MFRIGAFVVAALAALVLATDYLVADEHYGKQKVVYHINGDGGEGARDYKAALNNIRNHMNAVGDDDIEVKVVLHGDGVYLLREARKDQALAAQLDELETRRVGLNVCSITVDSRKIDRDADLYRAPFELVPSGVAELSRLQQQGYTYIKP